MNHKSNGAMQVPSLDINKFNLLPSINANKMSDSSASSINNDDNEESNKRPIKAFKFGQVDHSMLMSRLYSTPFNKTTTNQQYALEMGATSIHKPRIKKLENPPPPPEPVVSLNKTYFFITYNLS